MITTLDKNLFVYLIKYFGLFVVTSGILIFLLSTISSIIFYLGYFNSLGLHTSDISFNIFELITAENVIITTITYCYIFLWIKRDLEKENNKNFNNFLNRNIDTKIKISAWILFIGFFFIISSYIWNFFYIVLNTSNYFSENILLVVLAGLTIGLTASSVHTFKKSTHYGCFSTIIIILSGAYCVGMVFGQQVINGTNKQTSIVEIPNQKIEGQLVKKFNSGYLIYSNNQLIFIDNQSQIIRFKNNMKFKS